MAVVFPSTRVAVLLLMLPALMVRCTARFDTDDALPDRALTPGDTLEVTRDDVCTAGYTRGVRQVPAAMRRRVYSEYHRSRQSGGCCEVDHLIPLELGGSNQLSNLWPQPYAGEWNARRRSQLEGRLHRLVCAGGLELRAQLDYAGLVSTQSPEVPHKR